MKNDPRAPSEAEKAEICRLYDHGDGTRKIANALGLTRYQVRKALLDAERLPGAAGPQSQKRRAKKASKLDPYREEIKERVANGLTSTRILREIQKLGYEGGRSILTDYVREVRGPIVVSSRKITRRFETEPGVEAQVDWSPYRIPIGGKPTTVRALAVVLGSSRYAFLRFFLNEKLPALLEGLEGAFRFFQGVPRECLFDNMATVVCGRVGKDRAPLWNEGLLPFAQHYGFEPKLCRVRHPDRKGEVERFLLYAERDLVRGCTAESLADLNAQARVWLDEIANRRKHGTTGRAPAEAWEEERGLLIQLPDGAYAGACELEYRRVAEDCTVSIRGTRYTVPARLAHKQVRIRLFAERFEVLDLDGGVAFGRAYAVGAEADRLQLDPSHYDDLPKSPSKQGGSGSTKTLREACLLRWPDLGPFLDGVHAHVKGLLHVHLRELVREADRFGDDALRQAALRAAQAKLFTSNAVGRILERDFTPLAEDVPVSSDAQARAEALLGDFEEPTLDLFAGLDDLEPTATTDGEEAA